MLYAIINQVSHVLTILINSGTFLHAKEEVGNLCTFTPDNGREDAVKVLKVYLSETCSDATVEENYLWVVHIGILNKDVARVKVTVNKVVNKKLQRAREGGRERGMGERERKRVFIIRMLLTIIIINFTKPTISKTTSTPILASSFCSFPPGLLRYSEICAPD